jgi:hypothetical protein
MAMSFETSPNAADARTLPILAKTLYKDLRASGFGPREVMTLAGELLALVTSEVRGKKDH